MNPSGNDVAFAFASTLLNLIATFMRNKNQLMFGETIDLDLTLDKILPTRIRIHTFVLFRVCLHLTFFILCTLFF